MKRYLPALLLALAACTSSQPKDDMHHETLFIGGIIVPNTSSSAVSNIEDEAIYVTDGIVRAVGKATDLRRMHPAARIVDASRARSFRV